MSSRASIIWSWSAFWRQSLLVQSSEFRVPDLTPPHQAPVLHWQRSLRAKLGPRIDGGVVGEYGMTGGAREGMMGLG